MMTTTIYLIRHSKPMKVKDYNYNDSLQLKNEKNILSIEGEELAKKVSELEELKNIDLVISSSYIRAMGTAKYFASKNNLDVLIDENFGERRFGFDSWDEKTEGFEEKQFSDENFKMPKGESQKEVRERMYKALNKVLNENKGKRVAIVTHATAIMFLLKVWCEIEAVDNEEIFKFNNKYFFKAKGMWDYCQTFKLTFNEEKLIDIEIVEIK